MIISMILVFYDGTCATCHWVVKFLQRRSKHHKFTFKTLVQLPDYLRDDPTGVPPSVDSVVVVKNGRLFTHAGAVFVILSELGFPWHLLLFARALPIGWSNAIYDWFARNRFRWFGNASAGDHCDL